jgi:hypothetical protein
MNYLVISSLVAIAAASPFSAAAQSRGTYAILEPENDICLMACYFERPQCSPPSVCSPLYYVKLHEYNLTFAYNSIQSKWV